MNTTAGAAAIGSSYRGDGTTALTDLQFSTSGSERLRIDPAGQVGIGTTAPNSTLHVSGTVAVGVANGVPGNSSGTQLGGYAASYFGLSPGPGADYYLLPAASTCTGRLYYLRNNSSSNIAYLGTGTGNDGGKFPPSLPVPVPR